MCSGISPLLADTDTKGTNNNDLTEWVQGEYIIRYKDEEIKKLKLLPGLENQSEESLKNALTELLGSEKKEHLSLVNADAIKATGKDGEIDEDIAALLLDADLVEYISPNFIRRTNRVPNDPSYSALWGLNQLNNIDIDAPEAWGMIDDSKTGEIVVGVIDTGVDYNHPDLHANMWRNPGEINKNPGLDNDSNGIIGDVYGYNAITNSGNPYDDQGHGTHCAGTIGAVGNNGIGVVGVVWKVKIMALKFLDSNGSGSDINAIKAINYAISNRNKGGSLKVLSNSWGGSGYNHALLQAIQAANDAGILFVAAAGNDNRNNDNLPTFPAGYNVPNIISVAATAQDGSRASFSNYGVNSVHLAAPGVGILSTVPGGGYASFNGTSMATPHVSGVAVLAYSKVHSYQPIEVKNTLMLGVKKLQQLNGLMQSPGMVSAVSVAIDPSNFPPVLLHIDNQKVSSKIRSKRIPLLAHDKEGDPLSFSAEIEVAPYRLHAAGISKQYSLSSYQPQFDNFYGIGEKRLLSASTGRSYFIFSDGSIYELQFPYYSYRATVSSVYYQNPNALVSAYPVDTSNLGEVTIVDGDPVELLIRVGKDNQEGFRVKVEVSDGLRKDQKSFDVSLGDGEDCA